MLRSKITRTLHAQTALFRTIILASACASAASYAAAAPQTFRFNNLTWTIPKPPRGMEEASRSYQAAEKSCKEIGARLPTKDELQALNRSGAVPDSWYANVTLTSTPFGTNKHYTVWIGQLDGLGWVNDNGADGTGVVTCVK